MEDVCVSDNTPATSPDSPAVARLDELLLEGEIVGVGAVFVEH